MTLDELIERAGRCPKGTTMITTPEVLIALCEVAKAAQMRYDATGIVKFNEASYATRAALSRLSEVMERG